MKQFVLISLSLCLVFTLACGPKAEQPTGEPSHSPAPEATKAKAPKSADLGGEVVATVGDISITLDEFNEELNRIPHYAKTLEGNVEKKKEFLDTIITRKLMLLEASRQSLDEDKDIKSKLENFKSRLITEKLMRQVMDQETEIAETDLQEYYDTHQDEFTRKEQVRASHVLLEAKPEDDDAKHNEAKAKAEKVLEEVKGGGDFAELAKKHSEGPTARRGGYLGYFSRGRMAPEFDKAVFEMKNIDDVSEIVKTKFGYHIIKMTGKKEAEQQTFEQVKRRIEAKMRQKRRKESYDGFVNRLKDKADIQINDGLLASVGESDKKHTEEKPSADAHKGHDHEGRDHKH